MINEMCCAERSGRGHSDRFLRIGAVFVIAGLAIGNQKEKDDQGADKWDENQKPPPAAAPGVMEAADKYSKGREEDRETI